MVLVSSLSTLSDIELSVTWFALRHHCFGNQPLQCHNGVNIQFLIADTFTDSLSRLTGEEQKSVKTAAFDLQLNPAHPSLQFHRLDRAKDPRFWSIRVTADLRLIAHRSDSSLLLCYVAHHDAAYHWAERRKLETHPKTGAAQLVEVRETVVEIQIPRYVDAPAPAKAFPLAALSDEELLAYGVPAEWLLDVRAATEDAILTLADHLPKEAAEAVLELATGGKPALPQQTPPTNPFEHPDALRRFRVMDNIDDLAAALDAPWEKWTIFLHPAQRQIVERNFSGPARVSGSAGTGKTIVALHRAVHLAKANPTARVLLTTFSGTLAGSLRAKLRRLIANQPSLGERIEVHSMDGIGKQLYLAKFGRLEIAAPTVIQTLLRSAAKPLSNQRFNLRFLKAEWDQIVDAWNLDSWPAYRDQPRLGRKTRLPESQRQLLWSIFEIVRAGLHKSAQITYSAMFHQLAAHLRASAGKPFDFVIVDESQDIRVSQLEFLAALAANLPNGLFFAGDLGQRIFQQPFSWKALGVDIRGRASTLRTNYRTSHQIRRQADLLLAKELADLDGNAERRAGTVSLFNGPEPTVRIEKTKAAEIEAVAAWLIARIADGYMPQEIGIFVRDSSQLDQARDAASLADLPFKLLDEDSDSTVGRLSIGTMDKAKGLEFRAVAVIGCDDGIIPSQLRIESIGDEADLEETYDTERQLLYVACTRARDNLLITATSPGSEFLDDLR